MNRVSMSPRISRDRARALLQSYRTEGRAVAGRGEVTRDEHFRKSFQMTVMTLALGLSLFALFFGLVAACERL